VIETKSLLLREITLDNKEDLFKLQSDSEVQKYTGEPIITTMKEIEAAIKIRMEDYKKYGYGRWATILKNEMQFIGWSGLAYLPEFDEVDLGYRFLPQYWGLGLATEAAEAILNYGFNQLELEKIIAIAMKENKASIRVMEKIGMTFDKIAPYDEEIKDAIWYCCERNLYLNKSN